MAINQIITARSLPIETANTFVATFNVPTPGQYDFGVAANQNQLVIPIRPNFIYLIDRVSFSASVDEGVYLAAINTVPTFRLRYRNTTLTYPAGLPGINYKDGLEFNFWFLSTKRNDQLLVSLTGSLNQTAPLVGVPAVTAQISFVIYEENNGDVIKRWKEGTGPKAGRFYRDGG